MSGDRTAHRFDVVATTRRSWSRAQKRAIIAEIDVGGATLSEVARRHGIHASLLFRWRKTLGSAMGSAPVDAGRAATAPVAPSFVPVLLPPPASAPATTLAKPSLAGRSGASLDASAIEIVVAGGHTVRVGTDVDLGLLVRIIDALESHAAGVREKSR